MDKVIVEHWLVNSWFIFLILAVTISLFIRLISSILRAIELSSQENSPNYINCFYISFKGTDPDPLKADYWHPFLIGILELLVYPFLINAGLWVGIALWMTLKTLPQWDKWKTNRPVFNRFLIGNLLVLIFAFIFMTKFVTINVNP